jgi:hypothetical protein
MLEAVLAILKVVQERITDHETSILMKLAINMLEQHNASSGTLDAINGKVDQILTHVDSLTHQLWEKESLTCDEFLSEYADELKLDNYSAAMADDELVVDLAIDEVKMVAEQPVMVAEQPVMVAEQPVMVAEQPVMVAEQPVMVAEQPVIVKTGTYASLLSAAPKKILTREKALVNESFSSTEQKKARVATVNLVTKNGFKNREPIMKLTASIVKNRQYKVQYRPKRPIFGGRFGLDKEEYMPMRVGSTDICVDLYLNVRDPDSLYFIEGYALGTDGCLYDVHESSNVHENFVTLVATRDTNSIYAWGKDEFSRVK